MGSSRQYFFGEFRLDAIQRGLFRQDELISLAPKALETLLFLVERHGQIVDKKDLMEAVWPDTFVEEVSLARNVSVLRKVFSENEDGQSYIETIPKRGYRFVARVADQPPPVAAASANNNAESGSPEAAKKRAPASWIAWVVVIAVAAAGLAGYWIWRRSSSEHSANEHRVMLAVLPVQNLMGDTSREYVTDGLTEELIAQLGGLDPSRLGVIARTSSMSYKQTTKNADQIARELGVDYLLETSLRSNQDRIRFTAQLIRARDQTHVWAHEYDKEWSDSVTMEEDVARAVTEQIRLQLPAALPVKLAAGRPVNPAAHDDYLKGRYYQSQRSAEGLRKSLEYFQKVVEEDPGNARAYAGIADSLNLELFYGMSPGSGTILNAKAAADKAIQLDDSLAEGHAAMAYLNFMWLWEWPTAEREFQRAIQLDENYLPAHHWYALYLAAMDRRYEAIKEIRVAQKLDPVSPIVNTAVGYVYYFDRKYDEAIKDCRAVIDQAPNFIVAHTVLGQAYDAKGLHKEAVEELERVVELSGGEVATYLGALGHAYAAGGRREDATKILDRMDELAQKRYLGFSAKALVYAGLGDKDKAIFFLQRAREQNDNGRIWLRVDPRYDELRSDPRFQELMRAP